MRVGVAYAPGTWFVPANGASNAMRFGFSLYRPDDLRDAVKCIATVFRDSRVAARDEVASIDYRTPKPSGHVWQRRVFSARRMRPPQRSSIVSGLVISADRFALDSGGWHIQEIS
jgi:hypothetical protein